MIDLSIFSEKQDVIICDSHRLNQVTLAEDLKDKVLELLSRSLLPGLSNITFDWLSDMKPQKTLLSFFK